MLIVLVSDAPVMAHATGETGGFVTGFRHPISGWDHVLAMVAVGLWGAQLGRPLIWALPVAFPMMMALGGFFGLIGFPLPGVEIGIAASAIVLGVMVLGAFRPPTWVAVMLVGAFAVFHGHAHGTELPAGQNGAIYSAGFVIATGLLHGVGIGIGELRHVPVGVPLVRAGGAMVALGGCWFLWGAVGG
ncbi:HupE/UreJ family protein [Mucisphaera calidilacus]|uniref:HupE / UreJ protein n=1 Tax=Mucisphaera calidilacus TaxID=2527982 RepID=A0A518BYJ1_9BACT|nr:HupE/UreJ family protein [Mucisphaera calidilacus]QDU72028.1 HupE / UreJ protein [Mucisphaera calidilacus]